MDVHDRLKSTRDDSARPDVTKCHEIGVGGVREPMFIGVWWAHQDLNLEPTDYESAALTVELWAREADSSISRAGARGQGARDEIRESSKEKPSPTDP